MAIFNKKKNNVGFIFYNKDGQGRKLYWGKVIISGENSADKQFYIPKLDAKLSIREPSCYIDGRPFREITFNRNGDIEYLKIKAIDDELSIQQGIDPDEKTMAILKLKENRRRYDTKWDKHQTTQMIMLIIMTVIVVAGGIVNTIQAKKTSENYVENTKLWEELKKEQSRDIAILKEVAFYNYQMMSEKCDFSKNITTTIS